MQSKRETAVHVGIAILIAAFLAICLMCSPARCDDVTAARERLKAIEEQRTQAESIAQQALKSQADAIAAETLAEVPAEPVLTPEPDPISQRKQPTIRFEKVQTVQACEIKPRYPRAVLVCGQHCSPCIKEHDENIDIIGGVDMPIQQINNWLANDLDKWGITPGMQLGTPYLFIIESDEKVHDLKPTGLNCVLRGYQSPVVIREYLTKHGVSLDVRKLEQPPVVATVEDADATPSTIAAVLAAHLVEVSGDEPDTNYVVGGLFDFSFDVPDTLKEIGAKLLTTQRYEFTSAGITVDWSGPMRSFNVIASSITITPGVKVTLNKWLIKYSASLDGINYKPDLSQVTLLLTGAPDLTINLK